MSRMSAEAGGWRFCRRCFVGADAGGKGRPGLTAQRAVGVLGRAGHPWASQSTRGKAATRRPHQANVSLTTLNSTESAQLNPIGLANLFVLQQIAVLHQFEQLGWQ